VLDKRRDRGVRGVTYAHGGHGTMHAKRAAGTSFYMRRKSMFRHAIVALFPVGRGGSIPVWPASRTKGKNLRTQLSTDPVDFPEGRRMKDLALDPAVGREFFEHYKSDASGQRASE
jgi:hypothetical protein